jgi:hypothetical protein
LLEERGQSQLGEAQGGSRSTVEKVNALVETGQDGTERNSVPHKLQQPVAVLQGNNFVGSNAEIASAAAFVLGEEGIDEVKGLLHDGVLADIIVALELISREAMWSDRKRSIILPAYRPLTSCLYPTPSLPRQTTILGRWMPPAVSK